MSSHRQTALELFLCFPCVWVWSLDFQAAAHTLDTADCLPAFCAVCQSTLSLLQESRFPIPVNPLFQPHLFASSSTAWQSLLIFLGTSFTRFCIYWQNMAPGDTNCAVETLCVIRLCGRRKHGRISLISQWIVPVFPEKSLSCVVD